MLNYCSVKLQTGKLSILNFTPGQDKRGLRSPKFHETPRRFTS